MLRLILLALAALALVGAILVAADWWIALPEDATAEYVGGAECTRCHQKEADLWSGSDHDRAMDLATAKFVEGNFDDQRFLHFAFEDVARLSQADLRTLLKHTETPQWATALRDSGPGMKPKVEAVEQALRQAMPAGDWEAVEQAMDRLEIVRPCDVSWAQEQIVQAVRRLAGSGAVTPKEPVYSELFRDGKRFMVTTDGPTGAMETYRAKYVFGVRPLQQYLAEFPDGRVQCLPIAWDTERKRWFHLYPGEQIRHDDPLHWTGPLQNWNYMCAECHSTNLKKNYDLKTNTYRTTFSEIDVSCEACHGPGSLHVKIADSHGLFWDRRHGYGLPSLKGPASHAEIETCAPCHSRRRVVYPGFRPGDKFLDYYVPEMLDGDLYYPDGQILEEDYVYGSFLQSKMYARGVRCSDCHDPHTMRVKFQDPAGPWRQPVDNRLCTGCHMGQHPAAKYDTPTHHHHPDSSKPGTRCVECHMAETTYMVVDPRRDHSFRSPRPDLTTWLKMPHSGLTIPNACNLCHNDPAKGETPEWAEKQLRTWYGPRNEPTHFAYAIAAGREGKPEGEKALEALTRRSDLSAIVRASAILLLGRYPDEGARAAATQALQDPDGLVRVAAVRSLESLPPLEMQRWLAPMLGDPLRAVRTEAARLLSATPVENLSVRDREAFDAALAEYLDGQEFLGDQPAAHLNEAVVNMNLGRIEPAVTEYETALRLDPDFVPARINLAMLYDALGRKADAEAQFRRVIEIEPDLAEARYSLGLLLAEDSDRMQEAADQLGEAVRLAPDNPRMHYNFGLALQHLDKPDEAEQQFKEAVRLAPGQIDFLNALAVLYTQQKQWPKAKAVTGQLIRLDPDNPRWRQLLELIEREGSADGKSG